MPPESTRKSLVVWFFLGVQNVYISQKVLKHNQIRLKNKTATNVGEEYIVACGEDKFLTSHLASFRGESLENQSACRHTSILL